MLLEEERKLVAEYGKKMSQAGLSTGTSGNISICNREKGLIALSPSGMNYLLIRPEDVVVLDLDYHQVEGNRKPSSEIALHTEWYLAKPEAGAIVHTHSMYCTTFAVLGRPIEPVHYAIADAGTSQIPCAPYETFGTVELAKAAVAAAGSCRAVLLANHGLVVSGSTIESAYDLAVNMEFVAELQYRAECIGKPNVLNQTQMEEALAKFGVYGQKQK